VGRIAFDEAFIFDFSYCFRAVLNLGTGSFFLTSLDLDEYVDSLGENRSLISVVASLSKTAFCTLGDNSAFCSFGENVISVAGCYSFFSLVENI